jgi:hypothetical protein
VRRDGRCGISPRSVTTVAAPNLSPAWIRSGTSIPRVAHTLLLMYAPQMSCA